MRKRSTTWRDAIYYPLQQKTFDEALNLFLQEEFPALGGPITRREIVKALKGIVERYYPSPGRLRMGQLLWPALLAGEKCHSSKRIREYHQVPIALSLMTPQELEELRNGGSPPKLRPHRAVRLFQEAHCQGGVLAISDVAYILGASTASVSKWIRDYEKEHQTSIPCRGTIHDMGRKISHKALICKKKHLENKSTLQIAHETNHSPEAVDRYLNDFDRVRFCLQRKMNLQEIAFSCKLTEYLVQQYVYIIEQISGNQNQKVAN